MNKRIVKKAFWLSSSVFSRFNKQLKCLLFVLCFAFSTLYAQKDSMSTLKKDSVVEKVKTDTFSKQPQKPKRGSLWDKARKVAHVLLNHPVDSAEKYMQKVIPVDIPEHVHLKDIPEILKQKGDSIALHEFAIAIGEDQPLVINSNSAFAHVDTPLDFKPVKLTRQDALFMSLSPGDYAVDVYFFCSRYSIHAPSAGLPYEMGRASGTMTKQISTLLYKGVNEYKFSPASLLGDMWRIQGGISFNAWPNESQERVTKIIPDDVNKFKGDMIQQWEDNYNQMFKPFIKRSFDEEMGKLGDVGKCIEDFKKGKKLLTDKNMKDENLPQSLYDATREKGNFILPHDQESPSPWVMIQPNVLGRFTVTSGNLGINKLEFRVLPNEIVNNSKSKNKGGDEEAFNDNQQPTLNDIINGSGSDEGRSLIGLSIGKAAQAPVIIPKLDDSDAYLKIASYQPIQDTTSEDVNQVIFPLRASVSDNKKPSVRWTFRLQKSNGSETDVLQPLYLSATQCIDTIYRLNTNLLANNLDGTLLIDAEAVIDNHNKTDEVNVDVKPDDFTIRDIPSIMKSIATKTGNLGFNMAAYMQEQWFNHRARVATKEIDWNLPQYLLPMDWITKKANSIDMDGNYSSRIEDALKNLASNIITPATVKIILNKVRNSDAFKDGKTIIDFPELPVTTDRITQTIHENAQVQFEPVAPFILNLQADPIQMTLGDFSFYAIPVGYVIISNDKNSYEIHITKVYVYTVKDFQFYNHFSFTKNPTGLQKNFLGAWKKPSYVNVWPTSKVGFHNVIDQDYLNWRSSHGNGEDFLIVTDLKPYSWNENFGYKFTVQIINGQSVYQKE